MTASVTMGEVSRKMGLGGEDPGSIENNVER